MSPMSGVGGEATVPELCPPQMNRFGWELQVSNTTVCIRWLQYCLSMIIVNVKRLCPFTPSILVQGAQTKTAKPTFLNHWKFTQTPSSKVSIYSVNIIVANQDPGWNAREASGVAHCSQSWSRMQPAILLPGCSNTHTHTHVQSTGKPCSVMAI